LVDHFVSPSSFLKNRYVEWGLDKSRITVLENGQLPVEQLAPRRLQESETRNRFGYFGQINPFKGLEVLLKALSQLPWRSHGKIVLEVHGANMEIQTEEYRGKINLLLEPLVKSGTVEWHGPYQPHEMRSRMAGIDWVVVPSIWWENSPMVIQEALGFGRPLVVSDIGGMAEKVTDGVDGVHVPAGNVTAWARTLGELASGDQWAQLQAGIRRPVSTVESAAVHVALFDEQFAPSSVA
jgi:glycosyltransferase involved in cell wall biosynthesis